MIPEPIVIDFETFPIRRRPDYPPEPVGIAFGFPGQETFYMAFGHPEGNNATKAMAAEMLQQAWTSARPLLFHHAKFDVSVAMERMGFPELPWNRIHDTMFLAYLADPHAPELGLKPLAEDLLGWAPEERDAVAEWVIAHKNMLCAQYPWNRKLNKKSGQPVNNITPKEVGKWIFATPAQIVGPYACGDIARTRALFRHLWPLVQDNGMGPAYDRERQLMPILMENERIGLRVDLERLGEDGQRFDTSMERVETWLRHILSASGLNFDADKDVANVLLERGIVPRENWSLTESGELSVSKETLLPSLFTGPMGAEIASALGYRNRLKTCLEMFMRPWYEQASQRGGWISTNWNQTRGGDGGTRTGRPSTNDPNMLNISKSFDGRDDGYVHPTFLSVPPLPLVRCYVLPDEGEVFLHRDFDGQELRGFAHFEQGTLHAAYHADPALDPHAMVGAELMRVAQREIERTKIKVMNFQSIYGGGVPALQRKLRCSTAEAKELKAFHDKALPGRKILNEEILKIVRRGLPIRTWGGRLYFPERPGWSKKHQRNMSYEYKLINYLVQGSSADLTKQVIIDWHSARGRAARFLITVYDEINISAALGGEALRQMQLLKEIMEAPRLTVPMRSSPKHGDSWGTAKKCPKEKGCPLCA